MSGDLTVLRPASDPFSSDGGLKLLKGNLGRSVIKTSAVKAENRVVTAPALVFNDQLEVVAAFKAGQLARDFVAVVRYQGPRANGMPELHQLTPALSSLQDKGFHVALVTDGRMSGASGTVPAAIHVTPECLNDGPLRHVRDGDVIHLDSIHGVLEARVRGLPVPAVLRAGGKALGRVLEPGGGRQRFEHGVRILHPVRRDVQVTPWREPGREQRNERRLQQAAFVVPLLRPRIGEEYVDAGERGRHQHVLHDLDCIVLHDAQVG